jgi:hypothetical protein
MTKGGGDGFFPTAEQLANVMPPWGSGPRVLIVLSLVLRWL